MLLFLNTNAAGGKAVRKWRTIEHEFMARFPSCVLHALNDAPPIEVILKRALDDGETDVVAAGGDGTVNIVLNALLSQATPEQRARVRFGAVGLGSSNDFHKPFRQTSFLKTVPCKLDLEKAFPRDVGCLQCEINGRALRRYFLVNASCGVTAEANRAFNQPDKLLHSLKRLHTPTAILYAAIKTILLYRSFEARVSSPSADSVRTDLVNLAVLKSRHVSGSLTYDVRIEQDDGLFAVVLCREMGKFELLHLLYSLGRGRFKSGFHKLSWSAPSLTLTSPCRFAVEYDGEILITRSVEFRILPQFIRVCP